MTMAKRPATIKEEDAALLSAEKGKQAWRAAFKKLRPHATHTGIPDLADEHDHYLYGGPKRSESEASESVIISQEETGMTKTAVKTNKRIRRTGEGRLREQRRKSRLAPLYDLVEHAEDLGASDLSENYEHYLYGAPKQNDAK